MILMPEFRRQLLDAAANRPERGRGRSGPGMPRFGFARRRPRWAPRSPRPHRSWSWSRWWPSC